MRIFVTGGAGYVGSHCVKRLLDGGHSVTVYDNLSHGHRGAVDSRATLVVGDLNDPKRIAGVLQASKFDAVMHFAALISVGDSVREPLQYFRANVQNTINLLECMEQAGVKKLVFSSTCAVYGVPDRLPITEDLPKNPISPYGTSKRTVEWLLEHSAVAWGLGATALRYFNAAGAAADGSIGEAHSPEVHIIPVVLGVALGQAADVKVFGTDYPTPDGSCVRDYIHVEDLAEAHLLAIENVTPGRFEAFNVGTGRGNSVLEVIKACREVTGHPIPMLVGPAREGDPPALYANPDRLRSSLNWSPRYTDLTEIIRTAWNWHKNHPHGYRPA